MTNLSQSGSYFTEPNLLDFILSQSVSQLFHGPAPRSPLHRRLSIRLRRSRSQYCVSVTSQSVSYFTVPNLLDFILV